MHLEPNLEPYNFGSPAPQREIYRTSLPSESYSPTGEIISCMEDPTCLPLQLHSLLHRLHTILHRPHVILNGANVVPGLQLQSQLDGNDQKPRDNGQSCWLPAGCYKRALRGLCAYLCQHSGRHATRAVSMTNKVLRVSPTLRNLRLNPRRLRTPAW